MRHKKLELSTVLFFVFGLICTQAQTMYVKEHNGILNQYELSKINKMSFSEGDLILQKADNNTLAYSLMNLSYLSFQYYPSGTDENKASESAHLLIYPNPARDELNIDIGFTKRHGFLSILNLDGKLLYKQRISKPGLVVVSLSQLPKGIYLCQYTHDTGKNTIKIIKY